MKLPNGERAVVDLAKLRDYCLNPEHLRGRHKAKVFSSVLGITADDSEQLRDYLLNAAVTEEAVAGDADEYGRRFVVDFKVAVSKGEGTIRSAWIIRADEDFPRLTSCYVL